MGFKTQKVWNGWFKPEPEPQHKEKVYKQGIWLLGFENLLTPISTAMFDKLEI